MLFDLSNSAIAQAVEQTNNDLSKYKLDSKSIRKALLLLEEFLVKLRDEGHCEDKVEVRVIRRLGKVKLLLAAKGDKITAKADDDLTQFLDSSELSPSAENAIRNFLIAYNEERISLKYKNGINKLEILVEESENSSVRVAIAAFGVAVVAGLLLRLLLPTAAIAAIDTYALIPIKTIFLNALKMILGPLIFFSISSCIGTYTDLKELGKIGSKIVGFYLMTTMIAVFIALLMYSLFQPGSFGQFEYLITGEKAAEEVASVNFMDTIINIVPSNMFTAFGNGDVLQIIFISIIVGIATAGLGQHAEKVSDFLNCGCELFMKIATMIIRFIPVIIFVSITSLVLTIDVSILKTIIQYLITIAFTDVALLGAYLLIVFVGAKTGPIEFVKKAWPGWLNAFSLSSSNAAMSYTMKVCDENLGVKQKLYSFSIPLGATINMDGLTALLTVSLLFFAKTFGVELTLANIVSMIFTVVLLSAGTPGIPGGGIVCMSILLAQFNIPLEALSIFIALYSMFDPFNTANNVLGDMVGTYTVAKRNGYMKTDVNISKKGNV